MIRLPDWLYNRLARLYFDQRRLRRLETKRRIEAEDRALRALRAWVDTSQARR